MILAQEKNLSKELPPHPGSEQEPREVSSKARKRWSMKFWEKMLLVIGVSGIFFVIVIIHTAFYLYPARLSYQIAKLEKDIKNMERDQHFLKLEIAQARSLERIENIATTRLAMVPCKEGVFISENLSHNSQPVENHETEIKLLANEEQQRMQNEKEIALKTETNNNQGKKENFIISTVAQLVSGQGLNTH